MAVTQLRFGTANIKGWLPMKQERVRADVIAMKNMGIAFLATQETWLPRYRRALRRWLVDWSHNTPINQATGKGYSSCLSWDNDPFNERRQFARTLHKYVPTVCDKRVITGVILGVPEWEAVICGLSTHFVPGAWNPGDRRYKKLRQRRWNEGRDALVATIENQIAAGRPTVIGLDANRTGKILGDTIMGQKVRYVSNGIDHLIFIDAPGFEWRIDRTTRKTKRLYSDHDGLAVNAWLVKVKS